MNIQNLLKTIFLISIVLIYGSLPRPSWAEQAATSDADQVATIATLETMMKSLSQAQEQIQKYRLELQSPEGQAKQEDVLKSLAKAMDQEKELERNFIQIATGVDMNAYEAQPNVQFDWAEELRNLLSPIIGELRSLTNRPREIERLRREVSYYQERIAAINKALNRLARLNQDLKTMGPDIKNRSLQDRLKALEQSQRGELQKAKSNLAASEHQLTEKIDERKSIFESAQNLFAGFFRSRGLNLLVAVLSFLVVFLGLRYAHRIMERVSPWHRKKQRSFYVRLVDVVYYVFSIVGAVMVFLLTLYLYGDWVLLGLSLIFFFGLAWAARKGLPIFWQQAQLLLNLGTVREGEVVIFDNIPWKVETINVYTHMVNPMLRGGNKRLPLRDLLNMRSRVQADGVPWFPCREGDWVILSDETRGKVVTLTPEMIELVKLGGSRKFFTVSDFLGLCPMNISRGFRIHVTFGVDYAHQALVTADIPNTMSKAVLAGLESAGFDEALVSLKVEFKTAGSSSLDLQILADFKGDVASKYDILDRLINRLAVDACNTHHWVIPFTQITLHQGQIRG